MPPRKPAASSTSFASTSKPTKRGKFDDPDPELDDLAGAGGEGDEDDLEEAKVSSPLLPFHHAMGINRDSSSRFQELSPGIY